MKNLLGDNVSKPITNKKGVSKTIYFARINCPEFEQYGIFENNKINLKTVLDRAFDTTNDNYNIDNELYAYECDNQRYSIKVLERNDKFYFGEIYTDKVFDDLLEEYRDGLKNEEIKTIIIRYFPFFYIDITKKAVVYIGQKGLKSINKLFATYIRQYGSINVSIHYLGNKDLLNKIKKSQKLQSIEFEIVDNGGVVSKSLDKTLEWHRNINSFIIQIKMKKPTENFVTQVLNDPQRQMKVKKPILKFQDEGFNEYVTHLFEDSFTIKTKITFDDIDFEKFVKIRNKLETALNDYVE